MTAPLDVVVVGAGLSGLCCALRLTRAGLSVKLLEARDRIGGRVLSVQIGGAFVDLGAQWITPGQTQVIALAEALGVALVPDDRTGSVVIGHDPSERGSRWSRLPLRGTFELPRRITELETMSHAIDLENPAAGARTAEWDAMSLADWLARNARADRTRQALRLLAELNFATHPRHISLLHFLWSLAASGSLAGGELRGAGELRVVGGAHTLCRRIAAELPERIELSSPVARLQQTADQVRVVHGRGELAATRVVLAVPPPLRARIEVDPPLSPTRPAPPMAGVIKCAITYERRFWRDDRDVGEAYGLHGRVRAVVDGTRDGGPPLLLAFVVGTAASELSAMSAAERQPLVVGELGQLLGHHATHPVSYTDHDWLGDPWSLGSELQLRPGDAAPYLRTARHPHGAIHIAGTESATRWPRFLEGAVDAGHRAAAEVIAAISTASSSL